MATITTALADTVTAGKLFPDGTAIEQTSGGRLLLWQEGQAQISSSCTHLDCTYVPAPIDRSLEDTLQLSDGNFEISPPEELLANLSESFEELGKLDACSARLMASYVVATWLPESLRTVPMLNLHGPRGSEFSLLQMLSAVVRRPLRLADCPVSELARLPEGLYPTLILESPKSQLLQKLLSGASTNSGWLRGGRLLHLGFPAIVCTSASIGAPALCLPLPPLMTQHSITDAERQVLYNNFTPRLLAFRLAQHRVVASSPHHGLTLTPATASLARSLVAALAPAPQFQQKVLADLRQLDELVMTENSERPAAIVLEALLAQVHEDHTTASIRETTELVMQST